MIKYYDRLNVWRVHSMHFGEEETIENIALPSSNLGFGLDEVRGYVVGKRLTDSHKIEFNTPEEGEIQNKPQYTDFGNRQFRKPYPDEVVHD